MRYACLGASEGSLLLKKMVFVILKVLNQRTDQIKVHTKRSAILVRG